MLAEAEVTAYAKEMRRREEGAVEWHEQCERLRKLSATRPEHKGYYVAELCQAYEEATGTWIGCD